MGLPDREESHEAFEKKRDRWAENVKKELDEPKRKSRV